MSTILWSFSIWMKLERWKSSISGCLMSRPDIKKKNRRFEMSSSLILCNNEPFLDRTVTYNKKWILYDPLLMICDPPVMASSVAELRRSFKMLPKGKLAPKIGHGQCLVVCCCSDPLQLCESQQNHYIWEICPANDEMHQKLQCFLLAPVNRKDPVLPHDNAWLHITQPMLQKLNKLDYKVFPRLPYSLGLLPTNYHLLLQAYLQLCAGIMLPKWTGGRKVFPRVCWVP